MQHFLPHLNWRWVRREIKSTETRGGGQKIIARVELSQPPGKSDPAYDFLGLVSIVSLFYCVLELSPRPIRDIFHTLMGTI